MNSPTLPRKRPKLEATRKVAVEPSAPEFRALQVFEAPEGDTQSAEPVQEVRTVALSRDRAAQWDELAPGTLYSRFGRRLFDLGLLAVFGLPALALGLGIAALNWIQFGSLSRIFFVQERVGYRGEVFSIFKFRTMADVQRDHYESWGSGAEALRVTRFGRLLRNTHLDELPQLINVLRGEMAFVGPRPEMVEIEEWAASEVEGFTTRLAVHPGISGYAQITQGYTGHDAEAYREKFRVSDWYRRKQSFALDLEIIGKTLVWMVRGRGWQWKGQSVANREPESMIELPESCD